MALFWLLASAQAQEVFDFDTTFPPSILGDAFVATPPAPWDGDALRLPLLPIGEFPEVYSFALLPEMLLVTHGTARFVATTDADWDQSLWVLSYSESDPNTPISEFSATLPAAGGWIEVTGDLAPLCGRVVDLEIHDFGWGSSTWLGDVYADDLGLTGAVCPAFVDGDGDGACPQGHDADGDGTCLGVGEPLAFGEVADCDDARFGPACLALSAGPVVPGAMLRLTTTGAVPGGPVYFVGSKTLGDHCPALLGGACLGLTSPRVMGFAVADPAGVAVYDVPVPAAAPSGASLAFQAGELPPTVPNDPANLSPVVQVAVP